jgi:hypothetical protein
VSLLQSKLTDVSAFMMTERGESMKQIELELAEAKVRIAELESERDLKDMEYRNSSGGVANNGTKYLQQA